MKKRTLGSTNIKISEIGLGCASYWGKKIFSEKQAIKIVHTALDKGVNFLDTGLMGWLSFLYYMDFFKAI